MALVYTFGSFGFLDALPEPPLPIDIPFIDLPYPEFTGKGQGGGRPTAPPTGRSGWSVYGPWDSLKNSIFFEPTLINIGTSAAESYHRLDLWHTYARQLNIPSLVESGTRGMFLDRLDGNAPNDPIPALGRVEYDLYISLQTDSVIDAWFTWNFDEGSIRALNVIGLRAVIFPYIPQGNYTEKLEWATSILRTKKGEERFSVRANPRREVEYNFVLSEQEYSSFKVLALGWSPQPFALPLWMQATKIGRVSAGTNVFYLNPNSGEYEVGGMVALWDTNQFTQVGIIQEMSIDSITIDPPLQETRGNLYISPVKLVDTYDGARATRTRIGDVQLNANFYLPEDERSPTQPFPVWRGYPLMTTRPENNGSFTEDHYQEYEMFDFVTGIQEGVVAYDYTQFDRTFSFLFDDTTGFLRFKNFLGWAKGKYRQFWTPSWNNDLVLVYPIASSDTEIVIQNLGIARYRSQGNLVVVLRNGNYIAKQAIDVYENAEGNEVIVLSEAFGTNVALNDVDIICELLLTRADVDRVEFSFQGIGKSRLSLPLKTLPTGEI